MPRKPKDETEELRALFGRKWTDEDFKKVIGLAAQHAAEDERAPHRRSRVKVPPKARSKKA